MGDRANIHTFSKDSQTGIYFYSHWGGNELPVVLQNSLKKKWRWDDEPYLNRIIFCEMVKDELLEETGYGIGTYIRDNEHDIIEVDVTNQKVKIGKKLWSFQEYIDADLTKLLKKY